MASSPTASTSRPCGGGRGGGRRGSPPRRTSTRRWSTGSTGLWARWRWSRGRARAGSDAPPFSPPPEPGTDTAAVSEQPVPKVAPYAFPERYALPGRPAGDPPSVQDAHRQTHFLLPADLALFEQAMNLQLSLIAAQRSLIADRFDEYNDWLASALGKDREHAASYIDMGRFRAGSVLAKDERLGSAYRFLPDLTMPHSGSTLLQVGPDSGPQKLALTIGESAFHLGLAELVCGWLLLLAGAQTEAALEGPFVEPTHPLPEEAARVGRQ